MSPEYVRKALCAKNFMVISDAIYSNNAAPHSRFYRAFPKVIAEFVRTGHLLTLEEPIFKMTYKRAATQCRPGLVQKGRLSPGCDADVVVFDYDKICNTAKYDNPVSLGVGFDHVFVSEKAAVENDRYLKTGGGKLLKRKH